jgi:hypothetical protein
MTEKYPHGFNCRCPTCEPGKKADAIRNIIDVYRGVDCTSATYALVEYIDELEGRSKMLAPSANCPLCGVAGQHKHSALEQTIYRNGFKAGRASVPDGGGEHG